jgi:DNA-binding NtrC family response regulator
MTEERLSPGRLRRGGQMKNTLYPPFAVAVVDDEQAVLDAVRAVLKSVGITNILCLRESSELINVMERTDVGVVLLDLVMPGLRGEEIIPLIRQEYPDLPLVVIAGNREVEKAVECMQARADDYLTKPVESGKLVATVRRFIEVQELRRENAALGNNFVSARLNNPTAIDGPITADGKMLRLFSYAEAIACTRHPVLITGETGVGRSWWHAQYTRRAGGRASSSR